ncbi:hypothetical protein A2U01_0075975, partial [Trifolium medium]|nr:hypothetical protein [Trifolium medium]
MDDPPGLSPCDPAVVSETASPPRRMVRPAPCIKNLPDKR